jgi:paraquat-inducible protein B
MSESGPSSGGASEAPEVVVEKGRGLSPIWLIPIVALIVAGVLAYQAIQERGPQVVILFESAQGLEAGKSKVKYRDVEIGTVDLIGLHDPKHVEVHCSLDKRAAPYLTESTKFWVVRPRVGGGNISGLGTLISGAYLTLQIGKPDDPRARQFTGLEEPPLSAEDAPGVRFLLHTDHLGGLDTGSPVFFRDIHVGDVARWELSKDGKTVDVQLMISSAHAQLVRTNSRFWNAGGVELSLGSGGLDIKTESLQSIMAGGVAFDSPDGGDPAKAGDAFWLHTSRADVTKTSKAHGGLRLVLETGSLGGVADGNAVYYREVPVGAVISHELAKGGGKVRITVNIEPRYASLVRSNSVFWNAGGISADLGLHGLKVHAESLKALLSGGVAFATPPKPGHTVSAGSVFALHAEAKDDWHKWQTDYSAEEGDGDGEKKQGVIGRFFHHEDKTEEEVKQEDPTPEPTHEEKKHHFMSGLFHRGD